MSFGLDHMLSLCSGAEVPSGSYTYACLQQSRPSPSWTYAIAFHRENAKWKPKERNRPVPGSTAWPQALLQTQASIIPSTADSRRQCPEAAAAEVVSFPQQGRKQEGDRSRKQHFSHHFSFITLNRIKLLLVLASKYYISWKWRVEFRLTKLHFIS